MNKKKKQSTHQMTVAAALVYVVNQLMIMAVVIVFGFIIFEYREGLKTANYDENYHAPSVEETHLKDNKDHEIYTVVINQADQLDKKPAVVDLVSIVKYDKKQNELRLLTIPPNAKINQDNQSIQDLYRSKGLPGLVDELTDVSGVTLEHYMIMTPYANRLITEQLVSPTYSKKEVGSLIDTAINGKKQEQATAIKELTTTVVNKGFSKTHVWRLPKSLGIIMGYTANDYSLKEMTSLTKNLAFEKQKTPKLKYLSNESPLWNLQNEILSFFE